jgi:hypothetical protein
MSPAAAAEVLASRAATAEIQHEPALKTKR